ncbi:glycoside hydrolase family 3 C-terminal domain-containing protein [Anaeromicropila herbilytica]|uniref:Glycosyl hydrolase n=1 Tax=Anaeromicropila herbilytica TaxID=2785025 RepID=A0A7R7IF69_9FIRM|nr:glycoside hydrolase family 3 C-terminal domain-containing protein [Anaeromicropila herbilytica]BCN32796.1 glycosyl hydrolase [Anaeromicropila herbilytica]
MNSFNVKEVLDQLTIEEKASLCSAADFWHTKTIERLNIPNVMVSDGPHGLRKQEDDPDHLGFGDSVAAVCFPSASALACSFDRDLLKELGNALGDECQAEEVSTLLGPGINMKRSPLCGRNFEYYSEDPYLAGELAASYVNGVQEKGIGTSLKHFAANNQEYRRMSISANIDERTLREIYLTAFEIVVKEAKPTTLMCSYNRINGTYSCENDWLLNKVLRDEWGFEGLVMSDWGAMNERVSALKAGLDLEMPSSSGINDKEIVKAINNKTLDMETLDTATKRVLNLIKHFYDNKKEGISYDKEAHHNLARKIAGECAVLLKNDNILPLQQEQKVCFIGQFAKEPRYQGGGSSHIHSFKVTNAVDSFASMSTTSLKGEEQPSAPFAKGYHLSTDKIDEALLQEAVELAKSVEVAVIFAGLPDSFESEGYDRTHLNLPNCQNILIQEVLKVQPNTLIVLHNGSPVTMPWINDVKAVLDVYLGGQAVGESTIDLLYGKVNPSGKLAETFPVKLEDNPSYLNFPGTEKEVVYSEGIYIGYRYYEKKAMNVLFPFGHGLSYTTFQYDDMKLSNTIMKDTDTLSVSLKIKNTGSVFGKETVQLYVKSPSGTQVRPIKELKGFEKVSLQPNEEKEILFKLDKRSFAYYEMSINNWYVPTGDYEILVGSSSNNILLSQTVHIDSTGHLPFVVTDTTTCGDVYKYVKDPSIFDNLIKKCILSVPLSEDNSLGEGSTEMIKQMFDGMPIHSILSFGDFGITLEDIRNVINQLNAK